MNNQFPTNSRISYIVNTFDDESEESGRSTFDNQVHAEDFRLWFEFVNDLVHKYGLEDSINVHDHQELATLFDNRKGLIQFYEELATYKGHLFTFDLLNPGVKHSAARMKAEEEYVKGLSDGA
jgi:hypothetical protein